jgi:cystathionine beta-synthase
MTEQPQMQVAGMQVADSILDLIGHTPLVRLPRIRDAERLRCELLAKVETVNPGGSVKDRPAVEMIDAAEREGLLVPGGTIVEPTSGNTGAGLAIVAAQRGYKCVFVMSDKMSYEKVALLRAYGAEVVVCPTAVAPEDPRSYYSTADRLTRETPNAFRPDQYSNANNPISHYKTTGPELWEQTAGRITHFVAGVGTGGTITGIGRFLKEQNPDVQIVGADPEGSVFSGGSGRPYLTEGVGEDFWPTTFDPTIVDRIVMVTDAQAFAMARRVTRDEGLLIGGSCGTAVYAAIEVARDCGPDDVVVVLLPDSGRNYLSKLYDDRWMIDNGFLAVDGATTADILRARSDALPPLVRVHPDMPARGATALMRELDVSQLVVASQEPPLQAKEIEGSVRELELMDLIVRDPLVLDRPVGEVQSPPLPTVGIGDTVTAVVELLNSCPAVVVIDGGRPTAVLTRTDVLAYLAQRSPA